MDFDRLISGYKSKTCVMSVEKLPDGGCGQIRIVAGNKAHCDDMRYMMHKEFIPDSPYYEYFPQDRNFEDYCFRCAAQGQPLQAYVSLPQMGLWLNMILIPLESDREDVGYCIYTYDVTPEVDTSKRASLGADSSAAVLETCIKLRGSTDIKETFAEVVGDIRTICQSDHCCILLLDDENKRCINLAESLNPYSDLLPMDTYLNSGFYEVAGTWPGTLGDSTCVIIKDEHDMEWLKSTNPVWYESLKGAKVNNVVLFPLKHNGETLGYMWAINFNTDDTVKIKETLELTTFFIASEISNYQLLQRLHVLSEMDLLTGVKNRNAMNTMVNEIVGGTSKIKAPYTVVFADLNGLKKMNDENGHGAGDNLLKEAATIMQSVFFDGEVYRAGGDEFMTIVPVLREDELARRIERLMRQAEATGIVHFAIGTCEVNGNEDIRDAMRIADEKMYLDKKAYYEEYPERKYR